MQISMTKKKEHERLKVSLAWPVCVCICWHAKNKQKKGFVCSDLKVRSNEKSSEVKGTIFVFQI